MISSIAEKVVPERAEIRTSKQKIGGEPQEKMPLEYCEKAIEQAVDLPDEFFDERMLYRKSFALACLANKPVYDMYFLVLARRNNGFLLTLDSSLQETSTTNSIRLP